MKFQHFNSIYTADNKIPKHSLPLFPCNETGAANTCREPSVNEQE